MSFFIADALAAPAGDASSSGPANLIFLGVLFVVFYFLLIRPQSKRAKEHRNMVASLAKGDEVVTNGGTLGRISGVGEQFITVEIADGIEIKVQRSAVQTVMPKGTIKTA